MRFAKMLKLYVLRVWWYCGRCKHREGELVLMMRTPLLLSSRLRSCNLDPQKIFDTAERLKALIFTMLDECSVERV